MLQQKIFILYDQSKDVCKKYQWQMSTYKVNSKQIRKCNHGIAVLACSETSSVLCMK